MSRHIFFVLCCLMMAAFFICYADIVEDRKKVRPTDADKYSPTDGDKDCKPYGKKDCGDKHRPPKLPLYKKKQKLKWKDLCKIPKVKGPKKEKPKKNKVKPKDKDRFGVKESSRFVDTRDKDCDGKDCPPRFPLLNPFKDKLVWKYPLKKPVKKMKNKLKHKLAVHQLSEGCGIIAVLTAIEAYVSDSLALLLPNFFSMTTTTLTSTSFVTCTASTTACAARRRRAIVEDLLDHLLEEDSGESGATAVSDSKEYFNPSFYEDVPDHSGSSFNDDTPNFDPSFYDDEPNNSDPFFNDDAPTYSDPSFYDDTPIYSDPELLEGSIEDPSSTDLPYEVDDEKMSQLMMIRQFPDDQLAQFLQELGFNTVVVTETTSTKTTITSYPACSSQGTLPQC